jgi:hypothetical protein
LTAPVTGFVNADGARNSNAAAANAAHVPKPAGLRRPDRPFNFILILLHAAARPR